MSDPVRLKIDLPRIPDIELVAIEGLVRMGQYLGIPDDKIGEAKILVTEAVINGFEHSGGQSPTVSVEYTMSTSELTIDVRDSGKGFDPSSAVDPNEKRGPGSRRGWGLKLMKSLSDDFRIDSDEHGTRITLKKLLR